MATTKPTSRLEHLHLSLGFITLVATAVVSLFRGLPIFTGVIIIGFSLIFYYTNSHDFHVFNMAEDKDEKKKSFAKYVLMLRRIVLFVSFITPLLCFGVNEAYNNFPSWQEEYIYNRFTKLDEINDHNPIMVPVDSIMNSKIADNGDKIMISIKRGGDLYFYNNSVVNSEMILKMMDLLEKLSMGICFLLVMFTAFLIAIDKVGHVGYSTKSEGV